MAILFALVAVSLSKTIQQKNPEPKKPDYDPTQTVWDFPEIVKTQTPVFYNGPPGSEENPLFKQPQDKLNPSNDPSMVPEFPTYDALPVAEHFYMGVARTDIGSKKISKEELAAKYKLELDSLITSVFKGDKSQLQKLRSEKKAYSSLWLRYQLNISRMLELEDFLAKENNNSNVTDNKGQDKKDTQKKGTDRKDQEKK